MTKKQISSIMSKKSDHWRTPIQLIDRIKFDLDPCPYKCDYMDGLAIKWEGVIYCNPPYSEINLWVKKAIEELTHNKECKTIKFLIPARTDTKYFHKMVTSGFISTMILFKGRLKFNEMAGAPFPSILIYLEKTLKTGNEINILSYSARGEETL